MWFDHLINVHSAVQGIVILSLICTLGLAFGKIHVKGISLGIAFVFFVGIIAGHLGLTIDHNMLEFAESFGLTMFVYVLGLYVGPNFFGSMRHEGISLNLWSMAVILVGTLFSLALCCVLPVSLPDMVGHLLIHCPYLWNHCSLPQSHQRILPSLPLLHLLHHCCLQKLPLSYLLPDQKFLP